MPVCQIILNVPPLFGAPATGVVCVVVGAGAVVVDIVAVGEAGAVDVAWDVGGAVTVVDVSFSPQLINSMLPITTIASNNMSSFFIMFFILPPLLVLIFNRFHEFPSHIIFAFIPPFGDDITSFLMFQR
jgi:hypothetical protein